VRAGLVISPPVGGTSERKRRVLDRMNHSTLI
jgi:hypothetical protein